MLACAGALAVARSETPGAPGIIKPAAMKPGGTVGVITPATFVADPDRIALAERTIQHFGLKMKLGRNVRKRTGYVGGTIDERVADLHDMFQDPEVGAILAVRGGYGTAHLLDKIDYELIRRNPKMFFGYSDITSLHLAIHKRTGLVTFHGPVVLSRFTDYTTRHFKTALFEPKPLGPLTNPPDNGAIRPAHMLRTVRPGTARGRLIGGNLSLIAATMGTPYEIDTRGRILFVEDVNEQPYSIDRMLTQLRLAGKLDAAAAVIFGECQDCGPREFRPAFDSTFSVGEVVDNVLGDLKIPVLSGLTIGHTPDQLTLPIGVTASLDADKGVLTIEEAATT